MTVPLSRLLCGTIRCVGIVALLCVVGVAAAHGQALVDSSEVALADSLPAAPSDSLMTGVVDSVGKDREQTLARLDRLLAVADPVSAAALRRARHEGFDDLFRETPGLSLRVDGDRGMRAHLSTNPLDPGWSELLYDGVPAQNPADDESAMWDLPVVGVARIRGQGAANSVLGSVAGIEIETDPGIDGRTRMRTHFSSTKNETFYRAVSLRTPRANRSLRLDYGEWKTDEGALFSVSPNLGGFADVGRSKMRRFDLGANATTGLGQVSLRYARGTRFFRGSVSSPEAVERWNGRLTLGLDRDSESRRNRLRAYHLDWHVDDDVHRELRDSSRRGLSWESSPMDATGFFSRANFELRSARFESVGDSVHHVEGKGLAQWWLGHRFLPSTRSYVLSGVQLLHAENGRRDLDLGAWAEVGWQENQTRQLSVGLRRGLRAPSLLETDGWSTTDTVLPLESGFDPTVTSWRRESDGQLPSEKQDVAYLRLGDAWWGARWSLSLEHWRLRDGIGWQRDGVGVGRYRAGLELDRTQVVGGFGWGRRWGEGEVHLNAFGHRILGSLRHDESRGGGWPVYASTARAGFSRSFFSTHNRIGVDVISRVLGPRFDDRHVVLSTSDPALHQLDLEASLVIRDAEIRVSYDNLLDQRLEEVRGTFRRPRQMRLSLRWDFFN